MNRRDSVDKIPRWLVSHWIYLQQQILNNPARHATLQTLLKDDARVYTAGSFAESVADTLEEADELSADNYTQSNINSYIGFHANAGLVIRLPKINKPKKHLVVPVPALLDYLRDEDFNASIPGSTPSGEAACIAYYSSKHADLDDQNPSGITRLPLEATAFANGQQYADIISPNVSVYIGNLKQIREETDTFDEHLEFNIDVPEPGAEDTGWAGTDGRHNYVILVEIETIDEILDYNQLERNLKIWKSQLLAVAKEGYYAANAQGNKEVAVSSADVERRKDAIEKQAPLNESVKRLDFDMALTDSEETLISGCYALDEMKTRDLDQ